MELRGKLTTKQAAARLGVTLSGLRRMVYAGKLAEIRLSERVILYSEADVERAKRKMAGRRLGRPRKTKPWNGGKS